jgi:hypothetical protein
MDRVVLFGVEQELELRTRVEATFGVRQSEAPPQKHQAGYHHPSGCLHHSSTPSISFSAFN